MFTEAQKKQLLEWEEDTREIDKTDRGVVEFWVDSIPIRRLAAFQKAGIVTDFKDYGKDRQKCIFVDVRMLTQAVKEIKSVGRPTFPSAYRSNHTIRTSDKEWLLIRRFQECLESDPEETERALQELENGI